MSRHVDWGRPDVDSCFRHEPSRNTIRFYEDEKRSTEKKLGGMSVAGRSIQWSKCDEMEHVMRRKEGSTTCIGHGLSESRESFLKEQRIICRETAVRHVLQCNKSVGEKTHATSMFYSTTHMS